MQLIIVGNNESFNIQFENQKNADFLSTQALILLSQGGKRTFNSILSRGTAVHVHGHHLTDYDMSSKLVSKLIFLKVLNQEFFQSKRHPPCCSFYFEVCYISHLKVIASWSSRLATSGTFWSQRLGQFKQGLLEIKSSTATQ